MLIGPSRIPWPRRAGGAFLVELVALLALLVLWAAAGVGSARYWLIAIAAVAMGRNRQPSALRIAAA